MSLVHSVVTLHDLGEQTLSVVFLTPPQAYYLIWESLRK